MPYPKTLLLLLYLFCMAIYDTHAIDLSKIDHSNNYRKNAVRFSYSMAQNDSLYHIIVSLRFKRYSGLDQIDNLRFLVQEKFNSSHHEEVNLSELIKRKKDAGEEFELTFPVNGSNNYLVVAFEYATRAYYFDIPINEARSFPLPNFLCFQTEDSTRMHDDFKVGDQVKVDGKLPSDSLYFMYQYMPESFSTAVPPMVMELTGGSEELNINKTKVPADSISLDSLSHLVFIQNDSASSVGQAFFVSEGSYPKLTQVEKVVIPLVYISTHEEYRDITIAEDKKDAFESFWLDLIPSKKIAANTIKEYYQRIEEANSIFTSYKEGWRTDQGMIYTIYGPPDEVLKKESEEIWKYTVYQGDITFTFAKQKNLFTQHHYVLQRDQTYAGLWFSEVKKWRKGIL